MSSSAKVKLSLRSPDTRIILPRAAVQQPSVCSAGCVELYCLDQSSDLVSLPSIDHGDESSDDGSLCELWSGIDIPPWKAALASKSELYVHDVSSASVRHPVSWTFPTTLQEQQRHAVFSDLYFKRCESATFWDLCHLTSVL